jgi:hypothetical protein
MNEDHDYDASAEVHRRRSSYCGQRNNIYYSTSVSVRCRAFLGSFAITPAAAHRGPCHNPITTSLQLQ